MALLEAQKEELWRRHEGTGRLLGTPGFFDRIEAIVGRLVRPAQRGPKPKRPEN